MTTIPVNLIQYNDYINKVIVYHKNSEKLILTVSEIIKHPFYNKAAFKFHENKHIYLCEHCTLLSNTLSEEKTRLHEYINKTIYYPNHYFTRELITFMTPKVNNLFRVKSVFYDEINDKNYFKFHDNEEIRLAEEFTVYFDYKAHYKKYNYYKKIEEKEWLNMFNLFETLSYDLLFYFSTRENNTCKVKGYSFTQYEDKKWKLFPIFFDTYTSTYDITLDPKKKKILKAREKNKKIIYRSFFFRVKDELLEFENIYSQNDLKNLAQELMWSYDNKALYDVLQEKINDLQPVNKIKKKKI